MLRGLSFAIPPFETMYVEYRLDALLNAIGRRSTVDMYGGDKSDESIGHLICGGCVHTFIADNEGDCSYYPVTSWLHTDAHARGLFDMKDLANDRTRKLEFTLGSTCMDIKAAGGVEVAMNWLSGIDYLTAPRFEALLTDPTLAQASNGMIRNLVTLLLLLNRQRENVALKVVAPKGVLHKGKRRVTPAHTMVTLTVEDYAHIVKSYAPGGTHASPRRHQVRGFFRHLRKVAGCDHDYPIAADERGHWVCAKCGTVRIWVHDHERGDAAKGYVTKDYVVTD